MEAPLGRRCVEGGVARESNRLGLELSLSGLAATVDERVVVVAEGATAACIDGSLLVLHPRVVLVEAEALCLRPVGETGVSGVYLDWIAEMAGESLL
jgi:hypothetical protein